MNTNLATFITGLVTDENNRFYFVQKDGQTYALAKEEGSINWANRSRVLPIAT